VGEQRAAAPSILAWASACCCCPRGTGRGKMANGSRGNGDFTGNISALDINGSFIWTITAHCSASGKTLQVQHCGRICVSVQTRSCATIVSDQTCGTSAKYPYLLQKQTSCMTTRPLHCTITRPPPCTITRPPPCMITRPPPYMAVYGRPSERLNDQQTQRQPRLFNNLAATRQRAL
jgi:hypothetical protein